MPKKLNTKYQFYLDKLRELNLDDLDKSWDKDNFNMKLLLDGVQWQIDNYGKGKVW